MADFRFGNNHIQDIGKTHMGKTIPFRKTSLGLFVKRMKFRIFIQSKRLYWMTKSHTDSKKICFILGRQRSGTTMLYNVFELDRNIKVFREQSYITQSGSNRLRLKNLPEVEKIFKQVKAPYIVAKPLVESHRAIDLLDRFKDARVLWAFRNYKAAIKSDVNKFSRQITNLKSVVDREPGNWRSEYVSDRVHELVCRHYSDRMSKYDASALMWIIRNSLFYDLGLNKNFRVLTWQYEEFVQNPKKVLERIYKFLGFELPTRNTYKIVDTRSLKNEEAFSLNGEILQECSDLYNRLLTDHSKSNLLV